MILTLSARLIIFYFKRNRELDDALRSVSDGEMSSHVFSKILAIGLFDLILTFPCGVLMLIDQLLLSKGVHNFWSGWRDVHVSTHRVITVTAKQWKTLGFWEIFSMRYSQINAAIYGVAFFVLFGLTDGKRARYKRVFWAIMKPLRIKPSMDPKVDTSNIVFARDPTTCSETIELGDVVVKE